MKAIITGRYGFVGEYLADYLLSHEVDVVGYDLKNDQDLRDFESLRNFIDATKPDYIYHLAAQAYVPESFTSPQRTFEVNTIGSLNLLEAVKQTGSQARILLAGTSEEYGPSANSELDLPEPKSPYAISKLAMDYLGRWYADTYGMNVVVTRAFNHTGPGRPEYYAESSFAKQVALIEKGKLTKIKHGNLESIRNYTDVRDMVRAYRLAIDLPSDVYNICSPQNFSIKSVLEKLISFANEPIQTEEDISRIRPSDFSFTIPSAKKFQDLTDWEPVVPMVKTLKDILNYWRGLV